MNLPISYLISSAPNTPSYALAPDGPIQNYDPYQARQLYIERNFEIVSEVVKQSKTPMFYRKNVKKREVPRTESQISLIQTTPLPPDISAENSIIFTEPPRCSLWRDCTSNPRKQYTFFDCGTDGFSAACKRALCRSVITAAQISEGITACFLRK